MTSKLDAVRQLMNTMTYAEKSQVYQWLMQDLGFPGIERRSNVQGGLACLIRTGIPVWRLVQSREDGMDDAALLRQNPSLTPLELINAWAYYEVHRDEIDREIAEQASF
jgi:uncharacterized protein (DUF433 family)